MSKPTGVLQIIDVCHEYHRCQHGDKCATKLYSGAEFKPHLSLAYSYRIPDGHAVYEVRCRDFVEKR